MNRKQLEEKAEKLGKKLLIEDNYISYKNLEVFNKSQLIESSGNEYEALAIVRDVPVSGYEKNCNGRTYPKSLWEKVLKEGTYKGNLCLADHPKDEGSVEKIWGVWHNMKVNESNVTADLYLVEEKPIKVLKAGGPLGTSSVGFGELDEEDIVDSESYEIERLSDIVLNPSQGTYATLENMNPSQNVFATKENMKTEEKGGILEKNITNKYMEKNDILNDKNKEKEVELMENIQESSLTNLVNFKIKEAKKSDNPLEAIIELEGIKTGGIASLKEKVESTISDLQAKLGLEKKIVEEDLEVKTVEISGLIEKVSKLEKDLSDITVKYEKAKSIIEKVGLEGIDSIESEDKVENLKETVDTLNEEKIKIQEELDSLKEDVVNMTEDLKSFTEDTELRDKDIEALVEDSELRDYDISVLLSESEDKDEDIVKFKEQLQKAEDTIEIYEKILEEKGVKFVEADDKDKKDDKKDEKDDDKDKKDDKDEKKDDKKDEKDDDKDMKDKEEKKEKKESTNFKEEIIPYTFKSKLDLSEEVILTDKEVKESVETPTSEIQKFYEMQVARYGSLKDIKENILTCDTLLKAVDMVENFKEGKDDEVIELKENDSDEIVAYKF